MGVWDNCCNFALQYRGSLFEENVYDVIKGTVKEYDEEINYKGIKIKDVYTIEDEKGNMHKCVNYLAEQDINYFSTYSEYIDLLILEMESISIEMSFLNYQYHLVKNMIGEYSDNNSLELKNK